MSPIISTAKAKSILFQSFPISAGQICSFSKPCLKNENIPKVAGFFNWQEVLTQEFRQILKRNPAVQVENDPSFCFCAP